MYPIYMAPMPMNQNQPQPPTSMLSQMKQNMEEMEAVVKFMEDRKKKDEKPKPTWKDKKYGLVEIGTMMFIACFVFAIPITSYFIHSVLSLYHEMQTIFK